MRLFVAGPTGSGKSTLASKFAHKAFLPLFALDDIHWVRRPTGDVRRDPVERLALLEEVVRHDAWIIEGVQFKWADPAMERADHIVVLDLPRPQNTMRILCRFVGRRCSSEVGSRGTLRALMEEMRWSADYYGHERKMLFEKVGRWPSKLIMLHGRQDERLLAEGTRTVA